VLFNTPLLRVINLSIAVLLVALVGAGYWFAWRPLPETSGSISAPVTARATVVRDGLGVPHISAASWEDAIFLQGYVTAQDRMWQMDAMRRLAAGELAEVVGPSALESDRDARRLRLARIAQVQEKGLTPEARAVYSAYARGVNYYLETHRTRLPLEFTILKYQPRPWRVQDTILAGSHMYRMLTNSWLEEIRKMHMLERGDQRMVNFLFPERTGTEVSPGSNAWAISGAHTASGKPVRAANPYHSSVLRHSPIRSMRAPPLLNVPPSQLCEGGTIDAREESHAFEGYCSLEEITGGSKRELEDQCTVQASVRCGRDARDGHVRDRRGHRDCSA